jgi:quercetin dioxygenase-like cupin family protein
MRRITVVLALGAALCASSYWNASAQQTEPPRFTGRTDVLEAQDLGVGRRSFEAGARTWWHSHDKGQLLFVEDGRARVQRKGQAIKDLAAGDSDYTPPNVVHWHGATPGDRLVQVNIGFGGGTKWMEQVTDQEYAGKR